MPTQYEKSTRRNFLQERLQDDERWEVIQEKEKRKKKAKQKMNLIAKRLKKCNNQEQPDTCVILNWILVWTH